MQDKIYPTTFEPTASAFPKPIITKMKHPRLCLKREPLINPFSKEGHERANEKLKKEAEENRLFVEAMELVFA